MALERVPRLNVVEEPSQMLWKSRHQGVIIIQMFVNGYIINTDQVGAVLRYMLFSPRHLWCPWVHLGSRVLLVYVYVYLFMIGSICFLN